jgi:hypothetical protein
MRDRRWLWVLAGVASLGIFFLIRAAMAKPAPPPPPGPPPPLQITNISITFIQQPWLDLSVVFGASVIGGKLPYSFAWEFGDGSGSLDNPAIKEFKSKRETIDNMLRDSISVSPRALEGKLTVTDAAGTKVSASFSARNLPSVVIIVLLRQTNAAGIGVLGGTPPYRVDVTDHPINRSYSINVGSFMDGVALTLSTINTVAGALLFTIVAKDQKGVASPTINIFAPS